MLVEDGGSFLILTAAAAALFDDAAAAAAPGPRGKTQLRSAVAQLEQTGRRSSQRMWRRLHSAQPLRDLRWVRRVLALGPTTKLPPLPLVVPLPLVAAES